MVASLHVRQRMLVAFALVTFLSAKTYLSFSNELAWDDIAEGNTTQQPQLRRPCADEVKSWRNFILENDHEVVGVGNFARCENTGVGAPPQLLHERYCSPNDLPSRGKAFLAFDAILRPEAFEPEVTIVSPSHQDSATLNVTLPSLCAHTQGDWEIIFVLDGSWDDSFELLRNAILSEDCKKNGLVRGRIVIQPVSVWETAADNLGMAMSNPRQFYVEVQSDIVFCSDGWLERILEPLRKYGVLFAVGGRCGHALRGPVSDSVKGPCRAILKPHSAEFVAQWDHEIDIVQTVNRGPYAVRAKEIQEMGFFDEVHFLIAEDEHDLHRRATFLKWNFAFRFVDMYHLQGLEMSSDSFIPSRYQNLSAQYKIEHRARKSSNVKCPYPRFAKPPMRVAEEGEKWPI